MKLLLMNDPALRKQCQPVTPEDLAEVLAVVPEMTKILIQERGVALAANQVGIIKRFFLLKEDDVIKLMINPEVLEMGELKPYDEGCLSIPGTTAETQRAQRIKVKYQDEQLAIKEVEYNGVLAVALQHEMDHLNGKLYTDALSPMKRLLVHNKSLQHQRARGRRR